MKKLVRSWLDGNFCLYHQQDIGLAEQNKSSSMPAKVFM